MNTLLEKQFKFSRLLAKLLTFITNSGYEVSLGEAFRTPEQAAWNAAKGKGISASLHTSRLAVDLMLFKNGVWLQKFSDYEPIGVWWEKQDPACAWGGRFKTLVDLVHFSYSPDGGKTR